MKYLMTMTTKDGDTHKFECQSFECENGVLNVSIARKDGLPHWKMFLIWNLMEVTALGTKDT